MSNRRIGVFLSYILMIIEVLSTLLLTPFIIRSLGQAEYGVYKLASAVNAYLLLLDLGVGNATTRYIAKYRAEKDFVQERKFMGVATLYYSGIAIITVLLGIILVGAFPKIFAVGLTQEEVMLGRTLLSITMVNSAITLGTTGFSNALIAYEQFGTSKGASIVHILLRMVMTYYCLKANMGSIAIVSVDLVTNIIVRSFFVWYVNFRIKLRPQFRGLKFSFIKEVATYSSLILLQMIATQLNQSVDQILLGAVVASSSVVIGIYGVGSQITQYFQSIGSAFKGVMMPGIVAMVSRKASDEELCGEMIKIGRITYMICMIIWVGFLICGKRFILLWAGDENVQAYYVAVILMLAYMFIQTLSVGQYVLWAKNEHKELAEIKLVIVICNILLTILLIQWNPLLGATIGTFISLFLGDIVAITIVFKKKIHINIIRYYYLLMRGTTLAAILCALVGAILNSFTPDSWVGLLLVVGAMVIVYTGIMYICGLNSFEKKLVLSVLHRNNRRKYGN